MAQLAEQLDVTSVPSLDVENDLVEIFKRFDVLFLSRILSVQEEQFNKIAHAIKKSGIRLVVDIDDYWVLPSSHGLFQWYKDYQVPQKIIKTIKMASAVITTHERLAGHISKYNKNVVICPNAINKAHEQWNTPKFEKASFCIGWAGGPQHVMDIDLLRNGMSKLVNHADIQVVFGGWKEGYPFDAFEFVLTGGGKKENYKRIHAMDIWNYGRMYNYMDVALAPLYRGEFNMCKSELKVLEAAAKGIGVVVSDIHPFDLVCDESNSLMVSHKAGWYQAIMRYYNDRELLKDHALKLASDMEEKRNFDKINQVRKEVLCD